MKSLDYYIYPKQSELFNIIRETFKGRCIIRKKSYILVRGKAPVMLVAHMDTVHKEPVRDICRSNDGNILMSPQGIGGDDRCGVYALIACHEKSAIKPWLLFTCDEETGGIGASQFAKDYDRNRLPNALDKIKFIVEVDRRGGNDAVYYDCDNKKFEDYVTSMGFESDYGSFSDISYIAPAMEIAAVNLSSGYYNAHTQHEYIKKNELNATINKVCAMVRDACKPDFPQYEYVKAVYNYRSYGGYSYGSYSKWSDYYGTGGWYDKYDKCDDASDYEDYVVPDDVPRDMRDMYEALLDFYSTGEIEEYRDAFGDNAIKEMFESEFGKQKATKYSA